MECTVKTQRKLRMGQVEDLRETCYTMRKHCICYALALGGARSGATVTMIGMAQGG